MPPSGTRCLRSDERDRAVEMLATSFDDDPLFRWMLPEPSVRRAWITWFHRVAFDHCHPHDTALTVTDGPAHAAVLALPPGVAPPGTLAWLRALSHPPGALPTWRLATVGLRVQAAVEAAHPREPVAYVQVIGVHPSQKGRGLGGVLLREALAIAARRDVALFLETSNPVNLGFYRRFGLRVLRELRIGDAPPVWTMQTDGPPRLEG